MKEDIDRLEKAIQDRMTAPHIPDEAVEAAHDKLDEVSEIRERRERDTPFTSFLSWYLRTETQRFEAGERDEPLCECDYVYCDLKRGKVPGDVGRAESAADGIDAFQERHPEAVVLIEAREEWISQLAEYRSTLRTVRADLVAAHNEAAQRHREERHGNA